MSDRPRGPDWWQATDGRWYPPADRPTAPAALDHRSDSPGGADGPDKPDAKGFFASLYDFSFDSFVTPKLIRVFYAIVIVILTLGAIALLIGGLVSGEEGAMAFALIVVPIGYLVYVILTRIYFELVAALFRIADDLRAIRRGRGL